MNPRRLFSSAILTMMLVAAVLVIVLSANTTAASSAKSELTTRSTPIGRVIVDGHGRTLYLFEADRPNRSNLSRAGLKIWPAVTPARTLRARGGVSAVHLSVIGSGAGRQLAYFGHPLYYFAGDEHPGDTAGQGLRDFGALWFTVAANGMADTHAHASASAVPEAASTPAAGSYRY